MAFLAKEKAAPEIENEKAITAEKESAADVEARKADLARAKLNLDYSTIRAPIDGIVGAAQLNEGALVVPNDTTTLATIQQIDPVYADFTEPVSELIRLRRAFEAGDLERIAPDAIKVRLVLDDGTLYPIPGKLLFSEAQGRGQHRPGDAARRVPQSQARIAAGHVCPRPHRAGHRL
jgi:membrane fusion protein (multidrug efflux system)